MASEWRIGRSSESRVGFGLGSEFGFENPLQFFALLPLILRTDTNLVRHTLGFGFPALPRQKNLLSFFCLLPRFGTLPAPYSRLVTRPGGDLSRRRALPHSRGMGTHMYSVEYPIPPTVGKYSQPIILKVPETIGSPRDHFHLVVEPLGDAIGFAEAPHGDHRFHPAGQCLRQCAQRAVPQLLEQLQIPWQLRPGQ